MHRPSPERPGVLASALLAGLLLWGTLGLVPRVADARPAIDRRVELLVFGPGDDVFGRYGHAGFRVIGPGEADRVFNFGITDWTKPNYIRDFLTGRVRFWGNERPFARTRQSYVKWDRTILRYPLNLLPAEVDALVARMEHDVQPEHREYVYDTFRNNCATRLRDYLDDATGGALKRALADEPLGPSYREDVRDAFAAFPGLLLLTEIIPGLPLDAPRSTWERMYRPAVLGEAIGRAIVTRNGGATGVTMSLASGPFVERTRMGPEPLTGNPNLGQHLLLGFSGVLLALGLATRRSSARVRARLAVAVWVPATLLSAVLTTVALGTIWPDMQQNWLLLALPPTDLILVWPLLAGARGRAIPVPRFWRGYAAFRVVTVVALLGLGPVFDLLRGPLPPRLLCLVIIWLWARALDAVPSRAET